MEIYLQQMCVMYTWILYVGFGPSRYFLLYVLKFLYLVVVVGNPEI